jgi:uncharacterized protein YecE (DUF72 family)
MEKKKNSSPQVFIGTSGWSYAHWKENFYPTKLKNADWLNFYAKAFKTVEVNTTFYHTPLPTTIEKWISMVSSDFTFSVKASKYITHLKKLKDCQESLDLFYKNVKLFKSKLGPILFQLPPSLKFDLSRLAHFLELLDGGYKYTLEFRDPSWYTDEIYELLNKNNIALCISDLKGVLSPEEITSDFTYIRLHGPKNAYTGFYGLPQLKQWKKKIDEWKGKTSVYCYFDNDDKGYAIQDAQRLQNLVS